MSSQSASRKIPRRTLRSRRGKFETLEARLTLSVNLGSAGAFDIIGGSPNGIYTSSSPMYAKGGGAVTDAAGNQYVTINGADHSDFDPFNEFSEKVDLDPGPGTRATQMTAGLVKLDPNGTVLWTAPLVATGGTGLSSPVVRVSAAVDANQNVYITGDFRGTFDADPGPGVVNVTSTAGGTDYSMYMAKLNSAGQLQWVRTLEATELTPFRVAVDGAGNLIVASNFTGGTMDVDAGPGQAIVQSKGDYDLVVLKYSTDGNYLWSKQFGNAGPSMFGDVPVLGVSQQGDVFVSGRFTGNGLDLDPGAGVYSVSTPGAIHEAFIVRLNSNGDFVWAYVPDGSTGIRDIEVASDGSIVAGGSMHYTVDFDPGPGVMALTATGTNATGLAFKLNSDSSIVWARQFGGLAQAEVFETALDQDGNVYLGGYFGAGGSLAQSGDFDPGPGDQELTLPSTYETGFVLSLTAAGDYRWAVPLGGNTGSSQVEGLGVAPNGDVEVSGAFEGTGDFNPDPAVETRLTSTGKNQTVFTATLQQSTPNPGAPVVDAGNDQAIGITNSAHLHGTVTDDGLPNPVTSTWSLVSGSGTVSFANASALDTTATFSTIGSYWLALTATDGQFTTTDYVHIVVNPLTATLTATADTYIDATGKTTNFGTSANLVVSGNPDDAALLTWDLSSIPAGSTLQSATFSINVTNSSTNTYEIYALNRSWTESQATWKKANAATNWESPGADGLLDHGTTILGTVTASAMGTRNVVLNAAGMAVVQGWIDSPATNFGFILQDYANANTDNLVFSSKEATVAADRPQLQVIYAPPTTIVLAPRIDVFTASQNKVSVGTSITLSAVRENDAAHQPQTVNFYRDNGDGVLVVGQDTLVGSTYTYLGSDYTKWTVTADTTGLAPGHYTFFVQASNTSGVVQATVDVTVFGLETVSFASTNVPKAIPDKSTITSTLTVPSSFSILDVDVTLGISHTKDADLDVYLISPTGTRVALFSDVGGAGQNFSGTTLDDEAATAVASGTAPFTGHFRPQGSLSAVDGQNAAGVWTLEVTDDAKKNTGTLNSWSLQFTREAMPAAPAGRASLQAQPIGVMASPTTTVKPAETPTVSVTTPSVSNINLLAAVVANGSAKGSAQQLATTTVVGENVGRENARKLAALDSAIAALDDRLMDAFDFD